MTEQDNDIKKLFEDFNPSVGDDDRFMQKLENRMDGVEFLRESSRKTLRSYRRAIVAAAVAGVACGVLLSLFFPRIVAWLSTISLIAEHATVAAWFLATAITTAVTLTTFTQTTTK